MIVTMAFVDEGAREVLCKPAAGRPAPRDDYYGASELGLAGVALFDLSEQCEGARAVLTPDLA